MYIKNKRVKSNFGIPVMKIVIQNYFKQEQSKPNSYQNQSWVANEL